MVAQSPEPEAHVLNVDHLKSTGCKLPGPAADSCGQLGEQPHEERARVLGPDDQWF